MKKIAYGLALAFIACACAFCLGCSSSGSASASSAAASSSAASGASAAASSAAGAEEYLVNVVLEGGSGRATVKSPAKLSIQGDAMTATIVWSSSNYDKMVVDGKEYPPVSTEGGSTFEIPVAALDQDLAIQAETTAMSTPHMIDYTFRFDSSSLQSVSGETAGVSADSSDADAADSAQSTTAQVADFHNPDLGNGWQSTGAMPLEYAKCFTVDYYDGGYKLFCLSDGGRYLTVPEGAEVPSGIASDITIIQQPLSDVYLVASDTMCLFDALDALDSITVSGISEDNWYIPSAQEAMKSGKIAYGGKYSAPDYELLLGKKVSLSIQSTMINHTPDVREKLIELGIPVFVEMSSYETEPLGRTEWVKCYGAMLDMEDKANELFNEQVAQVESINNADTGKTVAFFYINSNGNAIVRKPGDYVTKMITTAGGEYKFNEISDTDDAMSSVTLEMERFYSMAKDADIIIYNASIDGSVKSLDDLIRKNALLADFKAVQDGKVWITDQNMYQQMMQTGHIIADFNAAITESGAETTYVHKLV